MAGSNRLASHRGNIRANGRRRKARGGDRQTRLSVERLEQRTLLTANFLPGVPVWQAQGPAPITGVTYATPDTSVGAVESILPVPTGSVTYNVLGYSVTETVYTIYAGTVNGGVWEADNVTASTLNAINWRPLSDNEPSLGVASMAYDPRLKTLWVGTGSVSSAYRQGGPDVGLLKSTDSGTTWTQLGTGLAGQRIVTVLPTANYEGGQQVVFAASLDGGGILRSNDGGKNFNAVTKVSYLFGQPAGTLAGTATDIVQDPNNANRFYAALAGQGVFESDDDGLHWGWIDNGIPQMTQAEGTKLAAVYDGTTHQTNLYAVTEKGGNVTGAWITHPVGNYSLTNQPQWSAIGTVPESKPGDPTTAPQADVGYG
ncbi:MAG TPA: hypothetical protein VGY55_02410, partial [Pirellulales bacterium]|nr:hypothetical protein [Pirellulales bacterium]